MMAAMDPNAIPTVEEAPEQVIGGYRVHPVAAMFPLLEGPAYEMFKGNIELVGQVDPIIVKDGVLIDGRNRIRVCQDLNRDPIIEEYSSELDETRYILAKNIHRRNLTDDQRAAIATKAMFWRKAERARLRQVEGGKEAGRGRPKQVRTNSCEPILDPVPEPPTRAAHARSTVGEIATEAKVSHHKAAQAIAIEKAAPEELEAVAAGTEPLCEVHQKVVKKRAPRKPVVKDSQYYTTRTLSLIRKCRKECSASKFGIYVNEIRQELKKLCQQ